MRVSECPPSCSQEAAEFPGPKDTTPERTQTDLPVFASSLLRMCDNKNYFTGLRHT
jgi:hypothetical protein